MSGVAHGYDRTRDRMSTAEGFENVRRSLVSVLAVVVGRLVAGSFRASVARHAAEATWAPRDAERSANTGKLGPELPSSPRPAPAAE